MKMTVAAAVLVLLAALVTLSSASPPTVPALLWSPRHSKISDEVVESVDYQITSPRNLAKAVLSRGGWSDLLCSSKKQQQQADLALIFVGRELQSLDISSKRGSDPALASLLKDSYTKSNFSLAFPYIATSSEDAIENQLVSGFTESCGNELEASNVAFVGSCSVQADDSRKFMDLQSLNDYLVARKEGRFEENVDLIMFCHGASAASDELDTPGSEREIFSKLMSSLEQLEEKYSVLYVSDPARSINYPSMRELERFLAESSSASTNGTCDGVCQIKSSLLEGLLVGIVLLLILICGLCCMAGIQTPTRFEAPQES